MSTDPDEASRNPHGYDVDEWSAVYDQPHHLYPGGRLQPNLNAPRLSPDVIPRRSLVYVAGAPGAGKSTLMHHLTRHCPRDSLLRPFAHDLLRLPLTARTILPMHYAVELGRRRDTFSGTDALSMNVVVAAEEYMVRGGGRASSLVLGEGDRLANRRFLLGAAQAGWQVSLVHLHAPAHLLDQRCRQRGSTQNAGWRAGRETKAINLFNALTAEGLHTLAVDARATPAEISTYLVWSIPALMALLPGDAPEVEHL